MRVGICYTKRAAVSLLDAFADGVVASGDTIISIYKTDNLKYLKYCDVTVQASAYNKNVSPASKDNDLRQAIQTSAIAEDRPALIMDTGAIFSESHTQIGFGGIKGQADFNASNSPATRWNSFNLTLSPWRNTGKEILILGQNLNGISTQDENIFEIYDQLIEQLPDIDIAYRHHPKCDLDYHNPRITRYSRGIRFADDIAHAKCTLSWSTNAVVEAIIHGIPSIAMSPSSIAYRLCHQEVLDPHNAKTFNRSQWLYDLSYSEWNIDEMRIGLPWRHLRKYVERHISRKCQVATG